MSTSKDSQALYKIGGAAALAAGILFRRNMAAEIELFGAQPAPEAVSDWFALLQSNRLLGLAHLHIFDLVNYVLLGLVFLGLLAALKHANKSLMQIAAVSGVVGIGVYFATNGSLSMLALSEQYASAESEALRNQLLAAGQALLATGRFTSPGAQPGTGGILSLLLVAAAGMIISIVMLRSAVFNQSTAIFGLLANGFDLAYCVAFLLLPGADSELLSVIFLPAAGLFYMIWHILLGLRLFRLGRAGGLAVQQ